ncbi:MAG: toxin-activating lysine-acyltransferase [Saccharospirillum sp.]
MTVNQAIEQPTNINYHQALGMMMWLMSHADYHRAWRLWSVDTDIVPALIHGQCKLYFDDQQNPVGFVTWAWLDDFAKQQVLRNTKPLSIDQWHSGEHLLLNDFVAPWGHAKFIMKDIGTQVFPEYQGFSLRRNADGSIRKFNYWKGARFNKPIVIQQKAVNDALLAGNRRP